MIGKATNKVWYCNTAINLCLYNIKMSFSPNKSDLLLRTVDLNYENKKRSLSMKWSVVNGVFFSIFVYDLWCKCPGYTTVFHYAEYALAGVLGANLLQHMWCLLRLPTRIPVLTLTPHQQKLLGISTTDLDSSFRVSEASMSSSTASASASVSPTASGVTLSPARAWRPAASAPPSPPSPPSPIQAFTPPSLSPNEFIADHNELDNYLKQWSQREASVGIARWPAPASPPSPPAPFYQLAPLDARNESGSPEEGASAGSPQLWWRLHLDPRRLAEFSLNLRLWIHLTILERLVREMDAVDEWFAKNGQPDVRVGQVSVERLRVAGSGAAGLLPFLEACADQRQAAKRIRELARGGCMSAYKWEQDAELVLSLVSAYLDTQLPVRFSATHVAESAGSARRAGALAVVRVTRDPPRFAVVVGEDTLEPARGRDTLLPALLLLLAAAAARSPCLHRVHLGPAGLNMLWIIGR